MTAAHTIDADLPPAAYLAALSALSGAGPARLRALLAQQRPEHVWSAIGRCDTWVASTIGSWDLARKWSAEFTQIDPESQLAELRRLGLGVVDREAPGYPGCLRHDPEPPPVLFADGSLNAIGARRVGIVGTRRCTAYGHDIAIELGHLLASNGVTVVSGLALGVDAAAHIGALRASGGPPVAVVARGLDKPYPRQNSALWRQVADSGVVLSEAPVGVSPERWRFPARNRIIAALSEVVVVVESDALGGSMYTAAEALARDIPVCAVPGPIRSRTSSGTNQLIADGCHVLTAVDDVLSLLDLVAAPAEFAPQIAIEPADRKILDALAWQPTDLDTVVERVGRSIDEVAISLAHLEDNGLVSRRGRWYERRSRASGSLGSSESP
jgi:DNA processing protein